MDEKTYTDLALMCACEAVNAGCDEAEVFLAATKKLTVSVNTHQIENILQANPIGLGLRVMTGSRQGFVFSSDLRQESLRRLAAKAVFLASKGTPDEANGLPHEVAEDADSDKLRIYDPATAELNPDEAIAQVMEMERAAYETDKRVRSTQACNFSAGEELVVLADSRGRSTSFRSTSCVLVAGVVAQEASGAMQSAFYFSSARSKAKLERPEDVGSEAARRAVSLLGAASVETQRVPVVMSPDVAAGWISNVFYALDGEEVLKNTTFLSDRLHTAIGSPLVTLVDDGVMVEGIMSSPFDGEGVATARNVLIDRGVCKAFVYNTYSGRRAGKRSTGNAARSYDSPPGIGHHNLYLKPGNSNPTEIISSVKNGLYVTNTGAFGFNSNTGDYSYEAAGIWIKDGTLASPVHEMTIASNSLDMLSGVDMVGDDLRLRGSANAPTIRIAEMTVSGRNG